MLRPLLAAALLVVASTAHADPLTLSVLSYNTHGLASWIALDDPATRFPQIAALTGRYDLAFLQEDFSWHDTLRAAARQRLVRRGNASTEPMCPICQGAGLTLLSDLPESVFVAWHDQPYHDCHGWLLSAADCWASKGFQAVRVVLPNGAVVHFANTHLEAGEGEADRAVRATQLEELRKGLEAFAGDGALVVLGDLNLHETTPADRALLDAFRAALGLKNSGARARPGSSWYVLDYILYRSGRGAELRVLDSGEDEAFVNGDEPLSDHPAVFTRFEIRSEAGD